MADNCEIGVYNIKTYKTNLKHMDKHIEKIENAINVE